LADGLPSVSLSIVKNIHFHLYCSPSKEIDIQVVLKQKGFAKRDRTLGHVKFCMKQLVSNEEEGTCGMLFIETLLFLDQITLASRKGISIGRLIRKLAFCRNHALVFMPASLFHRRRH
jgi:hypothetical protein